MLTSLIVNVTINAALITFLIKCTLSKAEYVFIAQIKTQECSLWHKKILHNLSDISVVNKLLNLKIVLSKQHAILQFVNYAISCGKIIYAKDRHSGIPQFLNSLE